jgi:hypothetical protein
MNWIMFALFVMLGLAWLAVLDSHGELSEVDCEREEERHL